MKKLLTIVAVALLLCLVCSSALAANATAKVIYNDYGTLYNWDGEDTDTEQWDVDGTQITLTNLTLDAEDRATIEEIWVCEMSGKEEHAGIFNMNATGIDEATGKTVHVPVRLITEHQKIRDEEKTVVSCKEKWTEYYCCEICGKEMGSEVQDPAAHNYVEVTDATCEKAGKIYHQCKYCKAYEVDAKGDKVVYGNQDALGHDIAFAEDGTYTVKYTAPACKKGSYELSKGKIEVLCARCGEKNCLNEDEVKKVLKAEGFTTARINYTMNRFADGVITLTPAEYSVLVAGYAQADADPYFGHVWGPKTAFAATCDHAGGYTERCTICSFTRDVYDEENQPALDAEYVINPAINFNCALAKEWLADQKDDRWDNAFICKKCASNLPEGNPVHPAKAPSEITFDAEKNTYTATLDVDAENLEPVYVTVGHAAKNAGDPYWALDDGNGDVWAGRETQAEILQLAKEWGVRDMVCAGEEEQGAAFLCQEQNCSVCGEPLESKKTYLDHKYGAYIEDDTYTPTLYVHYCDYCGFQQSEVKLPCDWVEGGKHTYTPTAKDLEALKECGKEEKKKVECTTCGSTFEFVMKREHKYGDPVITLMPTCTVAGEQVSYCTYKNCNAKVKGYENKEAIPATNHNDLATLVLVPGVKATCTSAGVKDTYKCLICENVYLDKEATTLATDENKVIAPEEHTLTLVAGKAATHLEEGKKDAYKCSVCEKLFDDDKATNEVTEASLVIPKTIEHDWENATKEIVKEATCTEEGKTLLTCVCTATKTEVIEKKAHTPKDVAEVPATCKEAGKKAGKVCEVCGTELEGFEVIDVDPTAHVWVEEEVTAATCTKEGLLLKTCSVCGLIEREAIAKKAHTPDEGTITVEPTKEAPGKKTFKCTVCGEDLPELDEEVPYVVTAPAEYTLTAAYDGTAVTGKLEHVEDTLEAPVKNIRVTFYLEGNIYMATMAEVAEDGTFSVDGVGPITYITVAANGNSSVNPEKYEKIAEPVEIFVK